MWDGGAVGKRVNPIADFEAAFAKYVGAKHAVAMCNGTATLHVALLAMEPIPGERVVVPPLTMSATTMAVLHAGCTPVFSDVDHDTWLMELPDGCGLAIPVSLYGLHWDGGGILEIDDAAQTLRPHGRCAFTSYSFQQSKVLSLGEGGMLATNRDDLAALARSYASLGYDVKPGAVIDKRALKDPYYARHYRLGWNYRMAPEVAQVGLYKLAAADTLKEVRQIAASRYREAIQGCDWLTPQHVPDGCTHDYWTYAVALDAADLWRPLADSIERHGGERPYAAWRLTYQEPAFRHLAPDGTCPVAESLQPRLAQFQTNSVAAAERNADALWSAIQEIGG